MAPKAHRCHWGEGWLWQECGRECGRECSRECGTSLLTCGDMLQPAAPLLTLQVSRPGLLCAQHVLAFLIKTKAAFSFDDFPASFSFPHN